MLSKGPWRCVADLSGLQAINLAIFENQPKRAPLMCSRCFLVGDCVQCDDDHGEWWCESCYMAEYSARRVGAADACGWCGRHAGIWCGRHAEIKWVEENGSWMCLPCYDADGGDGI